MSRTRAVEVSSHDMLPDWVARRGRQFPTVQTVRRRGRGSRGTDPTAGWGRDGERTS